MADGWGRREVRGMAAKFAADKGMAIAVVPPESMTVRRMREALQDALEYVQADVDTQARDYPEMVQKIKDALRVRQ